MVNNDWIRSQLKYSKKDHNDFREHVGLVLSGGGVGQEVDVLLDGGGDITGGFGILLVELVGGAVPPS